MKIRVRLYTPDDASEWDNLCRESRQGTFLHTRRFISYHGDRYRDCSFVLEDGSDLVGLLPAAFHPRDRSHLISHPGLTYGGLITGPKLSGIYLLDAMIEMLDLIQKKDISRVTYKAVPFFYHRIPAQDDLHALCRLGFKRTRSDLSTLVCLDSPNFLSERRRRGLGKAKAAEVVVMMGNYLIEDFWDVLVENLATRHGVAPAHSIAEMTELIDRFPENISVIGAFLGSELVAGSVLFKTHTVHHAQYIAASPMGRQIGALEAVFDFAIKTAREESVRFFDFGVSTEDQGTKLNQGLYEFKTGFGGGGAAYDAYELNLSEFGSS